MAEQNSADVGFEKQIWDAACVLRGNLDAPEYKQVVLGLILLKYISARVRVCRTGSARIHGGRMDIWRESYLREAQNGRIFLQLLQGARFHGDARAALDPSQKAPAIPDRQPESAWRRVCKSDEKPSDRCTVSGSLKRYQLYTHGGRIRLKDVKSGIVLAESMSEHVKAELVVKTIRKALRRWDIPTGCIFHSDRGSQYTSESVMRLLAKEGVRQSFSRVGTPGDNSWSESFFSNLKKETVHWTHFQTRDEARQKIFAYIEGFYNTRRVQKRLGYLSPMQWLIRWNQGRQTCVA